MQQINGKVIFPQNIDKRLNFLTTLKCDIVPYFFTQISTPCILYDFLQFGGDILHLLVKIVNNIFQYSAYASFDVVNE